jgi:hypothetical protein
MAQSTIFTVKTNMARITIIITLVIIGALLANTAIVKHERVECLKWRSWEAVDFADWQFEQCEHYGITIGI